jgi:hypothetical protein
MVELFVRSEPHAVAAALHRFAGIWSDLDRTCGGPWSAKPIEKASPAYVAEGSDGQANAGSERPDHAAVLGRPTAATLNIEGL